MTSFDPSSDELVSAYLDGEATEAERARVEADPELRSRVETFRLISSAVATPPPMPDSAARDAAIAAALGASNTTSKVTSLAPVQERRGRFSGARTGVLSAAAVILVLFLGGAILAGLSGGGDSDNFATDTASDASDDSGSFDADATTSMGDDGSALSLEDDAMEDDSEEEAMDEAMEDAVDADGGGDDAAAESAPADEAGGDAMEEEPAMEEESSDDSGEAAEFFETRSFGSLAELTEVFTDEEERAKVQPREALVFTPEVIDMADTCRTEPNESDTNSLVFIAPALLTNAEGVSVNVLVYRDEVIDADPLIRVFEFGTCAPIQ